MGISTHYSNVRYSIMVKIHYNVRDSITIMGISTHYSNDRYSIMVRYSVRYSIMLETVLLMGISTHYSNVRYSIKPKKETVAVPIYL